MTPIRFISLLFALVAASIAVSSAGAKPPPVPRYVDGVLVEQAPYTPSGARTRTIGGGTLVVVESSRKHVIGGGRITVQSDRSSVARPTGAPSSSDGIAWGDLAAGFAAALLAAAIAAALVVSARGRRSRTLAHP